MSSELLATYAGLGTYDGENYYKGDECLGMHDSSWHSTTCVRAASLDINRGFLSIACVKDLIRALKGDDDTCEIRRHLGKAGILQKVRRIRISARDVV